MRWLSIDPATKTGIARWRGPTLVGVATLRPATTKEQRGHGKHVVVCDRTIYTDRLGFWSQELALAEAVVMEEAMGFSPKTVAQLAFRRGYITACAELRVIPVHEVNTSSWRKVAGEAWGVSFPAKSDAAKALSIALVQEHYGVTCTDDEADAVLVGHWALRTRTVRA